MSEREPQLEPGELGPTIMAGNPRVLLERQTQQLAFYDAAPPEGFFGLTATPVTEDQIGRELLPRQIAQLLEEYESSHSGERLELVRLLLFDGRHPTRDVVSPGALPAIDQLVTFSLSETLVSPEELTVRSYLLFARRERSA